MFGKYISKNNIYQMSKIKKFDNFNVNEGVRKNYFRDNFSKYPYGIYFSENGMANAVGANTVKELIQHVAKARKLDNFAIFKQSGNFHSTTQEEYLVAWFGDGTYWDNTMKKDPSSKLGQSIKAKNATEMGLYGDANESDNPLNDSVQVPSDLPERGMLMFVYRTEGRDTTAGGVTYMHDKVVLVGKGVPQIATPSKDAPAVYLDERDGRYDPIARPVDMKQGGTYMFGGNFIYTSDSRMSSINGGHPIKVHDRFEDWETYDAMSR